MRFKGTIVITDPCYLDSNMPESSTSERWWDMVQYGDNLEATGIDHYICESTLYGDWSCNTYKGTLDEIKQAREVWNEYYLTFFAKYNDPSISDEEKTKLLKDYKQYAKQFNSEYTLTSWSLLIKRSSVVFIFSFNSFFVAFNASSMFAIFACKFSFCLFCNSTLCFICCVSLCTKFFNISTELFLP